MIEAAPYDPYRITYRHQSGYAAVRDRVTNRKVYVPLVRGKTGRGWRMLRRSFKTAGEAISWGASATARCKSIFGS